ncbi:MAG: YjgP/YjgQ family permease [Flavobacteriales bacterium]|nr:YjgP/YjgQ family permease [Flavobacteriales bacterium]
MKTLHKFIVSSYLGPFFLTFFIAVFVLLMQTLWKYIDDLVGKGLEWYIIVELMIYWAAYLVPLALPLAILFSSIMTFGSIAEHSELVALKAAGISVKKVMSPLIVTSLIISCIAFYFSNNIWPVINLKQASLLHDVTKKKPTLNIKEGVFYKGLDGYTMRVGSKSKDGKILKDIIIYDYMDLAENKRVITAETGKMAFSENESHMLFTLYNGYSYTEGIGKKDPLKYRRSDFEEQTMIFDVSAFQFNREEEELFKGGYRMLNLSQLSDAVDSLRIQLDHGKTDFAKIMKKNYDYTNIDLSNANDTMENILSPMNIADQVKTIDAAQNLARGGLGYMEANKRTLKSRLRNIRLYLIEWHGKFTLSFACLILFFVGAPLGAIIKKGGLGLPMVCSVFIFVCFHVIRTTGRKLALDGTLTPLEGMWLAPAIILPLGLFLTAKATSDSIIFDRAWYNKKLKLITGRK